MMKILFQKVLVLIVGILFIGSCFMSFSAVVGEETNGHDYYFIQFNEDTTPSQREEISLSYEIDFLEYHQDNTFLARIDGKILQHVMTLPNVRSVDLYLPSQKIHNDLAGVTGVVKLRINLHQGVDVDGVAEQVETIGAEIIQVNTVSVNFIKCIIDSSLIDEISSIKDVSWIQQEFEPQTLMNLIQTGEYQGQDIPQAFSYRGDGILTEVQDNGIERTHQDLQNVLWTDGSVIVNSHGTCVSGIMFGQGIGDPEAQGIQYEGIGAFAQWNTGNALTIANLWNGDFNEGNAMMNGVVQTNSWWTGAGLTGQYNALSNEIDQAAFDYPHVQIHWAIGNSNSGPVEGLMIAESMSKNCIGGGAIFHLNTADMSDDEWHTGGSGSVPSRGPAADGRVKPDLCGPFDWIKTTDWGGYTNTFGGNRLKLKENGLENKLEEINTKGVEIAKEATGEKAFVAASVGPTGKLLEPLGEFTFDQFYDVYREQIRVLAQAGADIIILETMLDIQEAKIALIAAKGSAVASSINALASLKRLK